ncbi:hypothetical protein B0H10DRAFT_2441009 [Mycena sp. CBHHK59/15]|nr:hypothetical protein B0H10DRAFT_2441009 [Mycena sp. CBHHK59/15]
MSPPYITSALTSVLTVTLDSSNWVKFGKNVKVFLLGLDSKIYHINVEKLTILDPGYGPAWTPAIPTLPTNAPSTLECSTSIEYREYSCQAIRKWRIFVFVN